jgi:hypothetical protein
MLMQVVPCNARPRNPEYPILNKAMIPQTPPASRPALYHIWRKTSPFLVAHQTPDQSCLIKS